MAGNAAAFSNYLMNTLLFDAELAAAVQLQGYDSFESLAFLDDKDVEKLCNKIRKPGGTIQQTNDDGDEFTVPDRSWCIGRR